MRLEMTTSCPFCSIEDPNQIIVFERDLVLFSQNVNHQGSLKHSGITIPKAHRETAFDLTREEWYATYETSRMSDRGWIRIYHPRGTILDGTAVPLRASRSHMPIFTSCPGFRRSR